MNLTEQRQVELLAKKRRMIERDIRRLGGARTILQAFEQKVSDAQLVEFILQANYGDGLTVPFEGLGEPFWREMLTGAVQYALEQTQRMAKLNELNNDRMTELTGPLWDALKSEFYMLYAPYNELAYIMQSVQVEKRLFRLLDAQVIARAMANEEFIDPQTGINVSLGYAGICDLAFVPDLGPATVFNYRKDRGIRLEVAIGLPSTLSRLDALSENRNAHQVTGHERQLQSGKIVWVTSHNRRNPAPPTIRPVDPFVQDSFVVYAAYDHEGICRYIGEGLPYRPAHVNSGCSHNVKLNEHFFRHGPLKIRLLHQDLSKDYARAVESFYIRELAQQLWNVSENEFAMAQRGMKDWQQYRLPTEPLDLDKEVDNLWTAHALRQLVN